MEDWGIFRYALPALGGGLVVYFLIYFAQKPTEKKCYAAWPVNLIMVGGTLMFAIVTWTIFFNNPPDDGLNDDLWLKPAFIIIVLIFLWMTPDTYFRRVFWNDQGVTIKRFLRSTKFVEWENITELTYKPFAQYWRLGFKDTSGFMFYDMMKGSKEFIQACQMQMK